MKKIILSLAVISTLTFSATAQENRTMDKSEMKNQKHSGKKHGGEMSELNLTAEQKAKLQASRADFKLKMDAIDNNTSLTEEQKRTQKEALRKEQRAAMESILTPEQKAKMPQSRGQKSGEGNAGREDKMRMKDELGLSNDQADKLKSIHQNTKAEIEAIRSNTSLSADAKKAQIKAIKEKAKADRKTLLTPDQQKKMEQMQMNRKGTGKRGHKTNSK